MSEPVAYLNGRLVPVSAACLPVWDLGLVMGATATEMLRTFGLIPYRVREHLERLRESCRILGLNADLRPVVWEEWIAELVERNSRGQARLQEMGISTFVTGVPARIYAGTASGGRPTVVVHTFPLPYEMWADKYETGQRLVTPRVRQIPAECLDPGLKTRSRAHWFIADQQAREQDREGVALLLSLDGRLTETATANLCLVREGRVLTPSRGETLSGVSQQVVEELCGRLGVAWEEKPLWPADLWEAEEAFTTSTPSCLLPVVAYDGRKVGSGRPGPVSRRLLEAWSAAVGVNIAGQMREGAALRSQGGGEFLVDLATRQPGG